MPVPPTSDGEIDPALAQLSWENGPPVRSRRRISHLRGCPPGDRSHGGLRRGLGSAGGGQPATFGGLGEQAEWPMALEIRTDPRGHGGAGRGATLPLPGGRASRGPLGATFADAIQVQQWMNRLTAAAGPSQYDRTGVPPHQLAYSDRRSDQADVFGTRPPLGRFRRCTKPADLPGGRRTARLRLTTCGRTRRCLSRPQ
ncbi:MAG: hypothetical protein CM1200mP2_37810 [Planctomycetaceae bacterium]|nr:MAG: hypothetical protein CM1200mP2_37810 [Planctomycetaceae bacterium]